MTAVQFPSAEVRNLENIHAELSDQRHRATHLREDFCGTAVLCREWARGHVSRFAFGVDSDPAVIAYGRDRTLSVDGGPECERVKVVCGDVRTSHSELGLPKVDVVAALNYGINYFHKRSDLMTYLTTCKKGIREGGVLVADLFGGATVCSSEGRLFGREEEGFTVRSLIF